MGRKEKNSLGVTTACSTTNKQTRAKRTTHNLIDVKQDELTKVKASTSGTTVEESCNDKSLLKEEDEDDKLFVKRPPILKTYKAKAKKIEQTMIDSSKNCSALPVKEPVQSRGVISDINQRPRRQIKHKFIKTTRYIPEPEPEPITITDVTTDINEIKNKSKFIDSIESVSSKTANNSKTHSDDESLLLSNFKLAKVVISDKLNHEHRANKIAKAAKNLRRSNRQNTRTDESTQSTQNCNSFASNFDDSTLSEDNNVHLVEIIDGDNNHEILEEIVETTTPSSKLGTIEDSVGDESEPYELYQVIDNDEQSADHTNTNESYLVAVDENNSNSQFSQNSMESGQKMYVEISENVEDNQQTVELSATPIDSDSQTSSSACTSNKLNSFSGAFDNVTNRRRKSNRLNKNDNHDFVQINKKNCINDHEISTSNSNSNSSSDIDLNNPSTIAMLQLKKLGVSIKPVKIKKNCRIIDSSDSEVSNRETISTINKLKCPSISKETSVKNPALAVTKRRSTRFYENLLDNNSTSSETINQSENSDAKKSTINIISTESELLSSTPIKSKQKNKICDKFSNDKLDSVNDLKIDNKQCSETNTSVDKLNDENVQSSSDDNVSDNKKTLLDKTSPQHTLITEQQKCDNPVTTFVNHCNLKTYSKRKDKPSKTEDKDVSTENLSPSNVSDTQKQVLLDDSEHNEINVQISKNINADTPENEQTMNRSSSADIIENILTESELSSTAEQTIEMKSNKLKKDDSILPNDSKDVKNEDTASESNIIILDASNVSSEMTENSSKDDKHVPETHACYENIPKIQTETEKPEKDSNTKISKKSNHDITSKDSAGNKVNKTKSHKSKNHDSDSNKHKQSSSSSSKSHHKSSSENHRNRSPSLSSSKKSSRSSIDTDHSKSYDKPSTSKKSTESPRDKSVSDNSKPIGCSKEKSKKNRQSKESSADTGKNNSNTTSSEKPKDAYSILSECYLPKMVKHDESLYSIEAFRAAQVQAIADAKAQAEASAKARAEAAAKAAAAALKAREDALARLREEAATKAREEAEAAKAKEIEEKAKALAAANRAKERAASRQRAAEAAKAREAAKLAATAQLKLIEEESRRKAEEAKIRQLVTDAEIKTEKMDSDNLEKTADNETHDIKVEPICSNISENVLPIEYTTITNKEESIVPDNNEDCSTETKNEQMKYESTEEETTIRRSGRIRTKTETNKREHGFGLVRDRERYLPYTMVSSSADHGYGSLQSESSSFSGSLTDINDSILNDIKEESIIPYQIPIKTDAEKEDELKNVAEGLSLFEQITDNEYKCERIISKESKKMQCDCFLTKSEIDRGELGCGEDCLNRLLMIECGSRCVVGDRCTNKRFQKIMNAECSIFKTDKKGFGMKAAAVIPEGEFIMEYVGEVLNSEQFEQRVEDYSHDKNIHHYFMALRNDCIIDATIRGNISRFINHSCEPNAETQKWTVNGELRVGFFSRRTIYPDQEITFDYKFRRYGKEAQKCYCNAANCRGWIGEQPDSDDEYEEGEEEYDDEEMEEKDDKPTEESVIEDGVETSSKIYQESLENVATIDKIIVTNQETVSSDEIEPKLDGSVSEAIINETMSNKELDVPTEKIVPVRKVPKIRREKSKQRHKHTDISEDKDLDMEISILTKSNLKNQSHTLCFSRLMVRAKQQHAKSQLLYILRCGELACRRLFLDYHGLKLLYAWMCDRVSKDMKIEWAFRLEILETLDVLPIPNKTMLKESKVLVTIEKWSQITDLKDCQLEHKSPDESPADQQTEDIASTPDEQSETLISQIRYIASKLLNAWETLTEVFRIPKKLRIEQMKEHEREADLSYQALGLQTNVLAADEEEQQRKRFRRDTTAREPWEKDKFWDKDRANRHKDTKDNSEWNMWKIQRRQMFEAQAGVQDSAAAEQKRIEDDSVHTAKCAFFRIDPRQTSRRSIPFCVNPITGQWYTEDKRPIAAPPSHAHIKPPPQQKSKNPNDYNLPSMDLPEFWKYAIDDQGCLYYYHTKIRIPQWEPPIKLLPLFEENKNIEEEIVTAPQDGDSQTKNDLIEAIHNEFGDEIDEFSSDSDSDSEDELTDMLKNLKKSLNERVDDMLGKSMQSLSDEISALATDQVMSPSTLTPTTSTSFLPIPSTITNKAEFDARFDSLLLANQRIKRRAGLVSERVISPRTDEERVELKLEMRRYRENKEKLRRRKEEAKRRRQNAIMESNQTPRKYSKLVDGLPALVFHDDDEDSTDDDETASINAVDDKIPDASKILDDDTSIPLRYVDELEVLKNNLETTKTSSKSHKLDHKSTNSKHRKSSSKSSTTATTSSSSSGGSSSSHVHSEVAKRIKDKFRGEIAGVIVQHLSPYRKDNCQIGRITNNEDFKHLAKKLTHFVMLKELKHCDNTVNVLVVTDSVKQKSKEFIRKYMGKFGNVYTKPDNEPEYKDFNFSQ